MDHQLYSVDGHCVPLVGTACGLLVALGLCWLQDTQGAFGKAIYYVCNLILAFFCK